MLIRNFKYLVYVFTIICSLSVDGMQITPGVKQLYAWGKFLTQFEIAEPNSLDDQMDSHTKEELCVLCQDEEIKEKANIDAECMAAIFKKNFDLYRFFICQERNSKKICGFLICSYLQNGKVGKRIRFRGWNEKFSGCNPEKDSVEFLHIGVHKDYRKHGIATQLMSKAQEVCVKKGIKYLNLGVYTDAQAAITCYKKFGFVARGDTTIDVVSMLKSLKPKA